MTIEYGNTCRCCLQIAKKSQMKNLHHTQFNRTTIYLLDCYKSCSGIEDPSSCENICEKCEKTLRNSYEFRQLCQESHQKYLEATNVVKEIQLVEVYPELEIKNEVLSDEEQDVARKDAVKVEEISRLEECKNAESDQDGETDRPEVSTSKSVKSESSSDAEESVVINTLNHYLLEGNFICEICDEMFDNSQDLNSHKKGHVWDTGTKAVKRDCPVCKQNVENILAHLTKNHTDYKPNTCRQCDAAFAFPIQLRKHLVTHLKGVFECKACKKKYSSLKLLKTHISQTRHIRDKYQCHECGLISAEYKDFLTHFHGRHNEDQALRQFFPCFGCKTVFSRRKTALAHKCEPVVVVTDQITLQKATITYDCDKCQAKFLSEDEMMCHHTTFCAIEDTVCHICNKDFKYNKYLQSHNQNVHQTRKYICETCGSNWATEMKLKAHMTVAHVKVKSFACEACGSVFKSSANLKTHMEKHTEKVYECFHCIKKFRNLSTIRRHVHKHMTMTEAKHKCTFCEKTFVLFADMRCHRRIHTQPSHPCNVCGKVYMNSSGLLQHTNYHHAGHRYVCNICNEVYGKKKGLYEHYFLHRGFKPYRCSVCQREEIVKSKFTAHLKTHGITFDVKVHGYVETDPVFLPGAHDLLEGCFRKFDNTDDLDNATSPLKPRPRALKRPAQVTYDNQAPPNQAWY